MELNSREFYVRIGKLKGGWQGGKAGRNQQLQKLMKQVQFDAGRAFI